MSDREVLLAEARVLLQQLASDVPAIIDRAVADERLRVAALEARVQELEVALLDASVGWHVSENHSGRWRQCDLPGCSRDRALLPPHTAPEAHTGTQETPATGEAATGESSPKGAPKAGVSDLRHNPECCLPCGDCDFCGFTAGASEQ